MMTHQKDASEIHNDIEIRNRAKKTFNLFWEVAMIICLIQNIIGKANQAFQPDWPYLKSL